MSTDQRTGEPRQIPPVAPAVVIAPERIEALRRRVYEHLVARSVTR
jgi:hypothetical protein